MTSAPHAGSGLIHSFSTGLLATETRREAGAFTWTHRLGADAPRSFSPHRIVLDPPAASSIIALGAGDGAVRSYVTTAGRMVFDHVRGQNPAVLEETGRRWGASLRTLHDRARLVADPGDPGDRRPRTVLRAEAWLGGGWSPSAEVIGASGLAAIRDWVESTISSTSSAVVHGHPGMAHWVVEADGNGTLLTGEDTGIADPGFDTAWVIGELTELHAFHPSLRPGLGTVLKGFLDECGIIPPAASIGSAVAFRLAQHAYDWSHYGGADDAQTRSLLHLARRQLDARSAQEVGL